MAIKRKSTNPIVYLDVAVVDVSDDMKAEWENDPTQPGKRRVKKDEHGNDIEVRVGRKILLQTGMPESDYLEMRIDKDKDSIAFGVGDHRLIVADYSEYDMSRSGGRAGSILRYLADVTPAQVEAWYQAVAPAAPRDAA